MDLVITSSHKLRLSGALGVDGFTTCPLNTEVLAGDLKVTKYPDAPGMANLPTFTVPTK